MKTKLIILLVLFSNIAFSQNEKDENYFSQNEKTYRHTLSFNINYPLDQWISKEREQSIYAIDADHLILLFYKYDNQKVDWRFGIGAVSREAPIGTNNFGVPIDFVQKHKGFAIQVGIQKNIPVWDKWDFIYGGDLIFQYRKFSTKGNPAPPFPPNVNPNYLNEITRTSIGLNTFLGVQVHLSKHISLSTELSLLLNYNKHNTDGGNGSFFSDPLDFQVNQADGLSEIKLQAPFVLYLNFQF